MKMMKTILDDNLLIKGLGSDIIEIERIKRSISKHGHKFLEKLFTEKEIIYCQQHKLFQRHFAGRFAAKEAIAKALGTGIGKMLEWKDMEILNNSVGKPEVFLSEKAYALFNKPNILISISHCKSFATATALIY
jgi:holo-[acyl-carrier protein] synthase